jgi:hypothetical protein
MQVNYNASRREHKADAAILPEYGSRTFYSACAEFNWIYECRPVFSIKSRYFFNTSGMIDNCTSGLNDIIMQKCMREKFNSWTQINILIINNYVS